MRAVPRWAFDPIPTPISGSAAGWCAPVSVAIARWASAVSTDVTISASTSGSTSIGGCGSTGPSASGGDPAAPELRRSARPAISSGDASTAPNGSRASVGLEVEGVLGVLQATAGGESPADLEQCSPQ